MKTWRHANASRVANFWEELRHCCRRRDRVKQRDHADTAPGFGRWFDPPNWKLRIAIVALVLLVVYFCMLVRSGNAWWRDARNQGDGRIYRSPRNPSFRYIDQIGDEFGVTIDLKKRVVMLPDTPFTTPWFVIFTEDHEGNDDGNGVPSGTDYFDWRRAYHVDVVGQRTMLSRPKGEPIEIPTP